MAHGGDTKGVGVDRLGPHTQRDQETWGIGILKTLWKVVEALIDTCLCASLQFYDVLHGFRDGGGTGADIMELNLSQDLASVDHDPLFLVFLYL